MSKQEPKITCDACGNDLTYTSNCIDYRLSLINVALAHRNDGAAVTAMMVYPAINADADFCGIECLRKWLDEHYPAGKHYHGGKAWARTMREERAKASDV